jgi:hypothetical protein
VGVLFGSDFALRGLIAGVGPAMPSVIGYTGYVNGEAPLIASRAADQVWNSGGTGNSMPAASHQRPSILSMVSGL